MPHCILEYSANLPESPDFQALFRELHEVLVASGEFKLEDIKSRAVRQVSELHRPSYQKVLGPGGPGGSSDPGEIFNKV